MSEEQNKKYTVTQTGQVKNAEGQLVTNNPQPASRPWIKLWVGPWLDGTTRWQTTGEQRAFWLDLLAMSVSVLPVPGLFVPVKMLARSSAIP